MDEITKALAKLPKEYRTTSDFLMLRLHARDFLGLNVSKLKGQKDIYRLKHGRIRIIFRMNREQLLVLQVGLRSEKTYRGI